MPKQLRDARLAERSPALEQHHGLVFRATVTTATDATHFKALGLPDYGLDADFGDDFFKGYSAYVVYTTDGAAPLGEDQSISAYTSIDGTIAHTSFTADLEVGDEVLLLHPSISNEDIKGTLFDTATDSLHAIAANIGEFLDIARAGSSATVTDTESNIYIDDSPSGLVNGISIKIDTSLIEAADTFDFKIYYRIESGGSHLQVADTITYTGVQSAPLKIFNLEAYRYGMKVTGQRTAGTNRVFKYEVMREV